MQTLQAADGGAASPPFHHPWLEALRMWWRQEPGHYDRLTEAVRLTGSVDQGSDPPGTPTATSPRSR